MFTPFMCLVPVEIRIEIRSSGTRVTDSCKCWDLNLGLWKSNQCSKWLSCLSSQCQVSSGHGPQSSLQDQHCTFLLTLQPCSPSLRNSGKSLQLHSWRCYSSRRFQFFWFVFSKIFYRAKAGLELTVAQAGLQ